MTRILVVALLATATLAVAAGPADAELKQFRSPSGNIGCVIGDGQARCDIMAKDWSAPRKPASCEFEWGNGVFLTRRASRARLTCASDTTLGAGRRLAYGRSIRAGAFRCVSRESGVTCRNRRGGGFRIAREDYDLF